MTNQLDFFEVGDYYRDQPWHRADAYPLTVNESENHWKYLEENYYIDSYKSTLEGVHILE